MLSLPFFFIEVVTEDQIPRASKDMFRKLDKAKEKEALEKQRKKSVSLEDPTSPRDSGEVVSPRFKLSVVGQHARKDSLTSSGGRPTSARKKSEIDNISVSGPISSPLLRAKVQSPSSGMRRLSSIAPSDEERLYKGATFGVPLAHLMFVGYEEFIIPPILRKTTAFLMQHLEAEGLFRISGSQDEIAEWKRKFNTGEPVEFIFGNVVCCFFLLFIYLLYSREIVAT